MSLQPSYIKDDQLTLFGQRTVVGFGVADFYCREIERGVANALIVAEHYSRKFYSASYIHLGVYAMGQLCGILQLGYAMNPQSMAGVVANTKEDQYLELNRMWLHDDMPRNTASRALSYAFKFIRRRYPRVAWVQSFADERCNRFGVVYQAASFLYCGEHTAVFWELDGMFYHNSLMTRAPHLSKSAAYIQQHKSRCKRHEFRQFRYIKCLKKWARRNLMLPVLPYPKVNGGTI